ncbi:MAG: hypothetical protein K1X94_29170 [Sandaracinaceae bacterium]|nr:hypothetical protein [Sandaracinaceae bacterium]
MNDPKKPAPTATPESKTTENVDETTKDEVRDEDLKDVAGGINAFLPYKGPDRSHTL